MRWLFISVCCMSGNLSIHILIHVKSTQRALYGSVMFNRLSYAIYIYMSFEFKCAVNSVALKLMLAPFIFIFAPSCSCLPAWWCKQNGSRYCRSSILSNRALFEGTSIFSSVRNHSGHSQVQSFNPTMHRKNECTTSACSTARECP